MNGVEKESGLSEGSEGEESKNPDNLQETEEVIFRSPLDNRLQIFTTGTHRKIGFTYVNMVLQELKYTEE